MNQDQYSVHPVVGGTWFKLGKKIVARNLHAFVEHVNLVKKLPKIMPPLKRKSKGKQHPLHAETLDHLADAIDQAGYFVLAGIFRAEAKRVRKILR